MSAPSLETTMESREEFMVSPVGDGNPTLRIAHFLKPSVTSIDGPISQIPSSSFSSPTFNPKKLPLTVKFSGWQIPPKKWVKWVDSMQSTYESSWRKVGIYKAIMSTKCKLLKDEDLLLWITERWCSKTNTFVFPWGEATITLEDVMILGGYPVLGDPVFSPLDTQELKKIEQKLILGRMEAVKTKHNNASLSPWMSIFMNSGREIEHEAFLSAWLSIFVFPGNFKSLLITKSVFPIAILLARGNPIALAPSVLAAIYKDLTLLKRSIVDLTPSPVYGDKNSLQLNFVPQSPFYLVQIWVWERIEALQPKPVLINNGDPFLARWHGVKALKVDNVRSILDTAKDHFIWRPYTRILAGKSKIFYAENSICVLNDHTLDKELESFVICLRVSELVGIDCIEQYLPHRVSMQFGMDQDLPGSVTRFSETPEIAWANYCRPIMDTNVYIPSRFFEAGVTTRYAEWWKQSVLGHQDLVKNDLLKNFLKGKRSARCSKKRTNLEADFSTSFAPKCRSNPVDYGKSCGSLTKRFKTAISENFLEKIRSDNNADVPPGFSQNSSDPTAKCGAEGKGSNNSVDTIAVNVESKLSELERVWTEVKKRR